MKKYNLFFVFMCFQIITSAQNHVNIRLEPIAQGNTTLQCYNFQLAPADGRDITLAGQNYRLYYDASLLSYSSSELLLPKEKYENFQIRNIIGHESAQGMGYLPFENHLGLLSVSLDLDDTRDGGITLDAFGEWVNTCQVCFDNIQSKTGEETGSIIWARPELTASYATAYVEVSEWVGRNETVPAVVDQYEDMAFSTTASSNVQWQETPTIYPNPIKDQLWIKQTAQRVTDVHIVSITGQQIYAGQIDQGDTEHVLNLQHLAAGMYQLRLTKGGQQHIQFIEKQ